MIIFVALALGILCTWAALSNLALLLGGIAGIGLLALLLWRPQTTLVLYPVLLLILPVVTRGGDVLQTGVRADQVLLLVALVSAGCYLAVHRLPLPLNHLLGIYGIYLLAFIASISYSKFALGYPAGMRDFIQFAGLARPLVIMLVFMVLINSVRRTWLVVNTILATSVFVLWLGFSQLAEAPWAKALTLAFYNRKGVLADWLLFQRITATFDGHSNQAGFFAYTLCGLLAGLLICMPREHLRRWGFAYIVMLGGALYFLVGTGSRTALAALLGAAAITIFLGGRRDLILATATAIPAAIAAALTFVPTIRIRLLELANVLLGQTTLNQVAGERAVWWQENLDAFFWPSPILGSGPNFLVGDSSYVLELCLRGILGLLIYCSMLLLVARAGYVTWRHGQHPLGRALGVCVLVATIGIMLQGFTVTVLVGTRPAELYFLLIAAMWLYYPAQRRIALGATREPGSTGQGIYPAPGD